MKRIFELTKSFTAGFAIIALIIVSVYGVNSLNPVAQFKLISGESEVAGINDIKIRAGNVVIKEVSNNMQIDESRIAFKILPGQTSSDVGTITLSNRNNFDTYTNISTLISADLDKIVRIELIDLNNKILLLDFNKYFDHQKVSFEKSSDRTFTVRYILSKPLNYVSKASLVIR